MQKSLGNYVVKFFRAQASHICPHGCDLFRQDLRNAGYIPPSEYKFKWTHKHIVSLSTNHALDYWWTEMAEDMKHSELAVNFAELRKTEDDLAGEVEAKRRPIEGCFV